MESPIIISDRLSGKETTKLLAVLENTTTHVGFCDIPSILQKVVIFLCFIICDTCMMKIRLLSIPCNKRYSMTKLHFFIINFVMILLSSLIYDDSFSSLKIYKMSQNLVSE
jgi:hypothetical protein